MTGFGDGWTNDYVGVPYTDLGRDRSGWDCWGLAVVAYREQAGIALPTLDGDYRSAHEDPDGVRACFEDEAKAWQQVETPQPGDVIWLRIAGLERHVGLWVQGNRMLHAFPGRETCVEMLRSPSWSRRVVSYWRHPVRS